MSTADLAVPSLHPAVPPQAAQRQNGVPMEASGATIAAPASSEACRRSRREKFLPVTRFALFDRLSSPSAWHDGEAAEVRRFFRYLNYWRRQQYNAMLLELEQAYEPFDPDSDLLVTRTFTQGERLQMQARVIALMEKILTQANYERIDPSDVEVILTRESHYGLDLYVDLKAFDEILLFYRGAGTLRERRRSLKKLLRGEEFEIPVYRRLFILFKLKPFAARVQEIMTEQKISRREAERIVKRMRALLPAQVTDGNIYMKLFKNIPRADMEMIFPNTIIRFRLLDKIKLGVTASGGLGMGAFGAAGKLALLLSNPVAAAGAIVGLGGVAFRQAMNFVNQKQRYMVVMARNLYFHSMADNRGVMVELADRAAAEDVKEEMLLYTVLAKEPANRRDLPEIDKAIERYMRSTFGIDVDFDLDDALSRLMADGIVREAADGTLVTLPPAEAAKHLDDMWDVFLDRLPDPVTTEGREVQSNSAVAPA